MNNDIDGEIVIPSLNSMSAKYTLIGANNSDTFAEIEIATRGDSDVLAEITPRVFGNSQVDSDIMVKYGDSSDTYAELQPMGGHNVDAEIIVFPGNSMSAIYEVIEPPRITAKLNPIEDAFTRDRPPYNTINYGKNNSLTVGNYDGENYQSFLKFSFKDWSKKNVILSAKIRIYYNDVLDENTPLGLFTLNKNWTETGITDRNKPVAEELITSEYTVNHSKKYVEFIVTDTVIDWIQSDKNNGFTVKSLEENIKLITFRSRESFSPPELTVVYFDSKIYSASKTQTNATLLVMHGRQSDTDAEITVKSTIGKDDTLAELYVHRYEDVVDNDKEAEITVTKSKVDGEIIVAITDECMVDAELSVRISESNVLDAELIVSKAICEAEITVAHTDGIESELIVQKRDVDDSLAELSVTRETIDAELFVKYRDDVNANLIVQNRDHFDALCVISVSREAVQSEVFVKYNSDLHSDITVAKRDDSDIASSLTVTRIETLAEIIVKAIDDSDTSSEIIVTVRDYNKVDSEVSVTREFVFAELTIVEITETQAELFVPFHNYTLAELRVHLSDDIEAIVDVIKVSEVASELSVTRQNVDAEIMIPYRDDSDVESKIYVRVLRVSDTLASIQVGQPDPVGESYVFII